MIEKIKETRKNSQMAQDFFIKRLAYTLGPVELKNFIQKGGVRIVDVRDRTDYEISHIPEAISIPKSELVDNLDKLSKDEISIVYCYNQQCHLGDSACLTLAQYGYPTMLMEGGFRAWVNDFRFTTVAGAGE